MWFGIYLSRICADSYTSKFKVVYSGCMTNEMPVAQREEKNFREQVEALRKAQGLTQKQLAERMNADGWKDYSQASVSRLEKNQRPISLGEARALAHVLSSTVEAMITPSELHQKVAKLQTETTNLSLLKDVLLSKAGLYEGVRVQLLEALEDLSASLSDSKNAQSISNLRHQIIELAHSALFIAPHSAQSVVAETVNDLFPFNKHERSLSDEEYRERVEEILSENQKLQEISQNAKRLEVIRNRKTK